MKKLGKIKDLLSREEMRQIQGGSGTLCRYDSHCPTGQTCKKSSPGPWFPSYYGHCV